MHVSFILFQLKEAIEVELRGRGLQVTPFIVTKVIQLYETKNSRHSSMLVGKTGSAKSVTWRTLQNALTALHQKGVSDFQPVQVGMDEEEICCIQKIEKHYIFFFSLLLHFPFLTFVSQFLSLLLDFTGIPAHMH